MQNDSTMSFWALAKNLMGRYYYTYIATNKNNTVLYTGVTNDLARRSYEHKNKIINGFTAKYNVNKIVWYNAFSSPYEAIAAEKTIKGRTRAKKIKLIASINHEFKDLDPSPSAQDDKMRIQDDRNDRLWWLINFDFYILNLWMTNLL